MPRRKRKYHIQAQCMILWQSLWRQYIFAICETEREKHSFFLIGVSLFSTYRSLSLSLSRWLVHTISYSLALLHIKHERMSRKAEILVRINKCVNEIVKLLLL